MRVMVVTWLVHIGSSVSAWQKRYISEKCLKMRVLRFLKSGPSVKICFGFLGIWRIYSSKVKLKNDYYNDIFLEWALLLNLEFRFTSVFYFISIWTTSRGVGCEVPQYENKQRRFWCRLLNGYCSHTLFLQSLLDWLDLQDEMGSIDCALLLDEILPSERHNPSVLFDESLIPKRKYFQSKRRRSAKWMRMSVTGKILCTQPFISAVSEE